MTATEKVIKNKLGLLENGVASSSEVDVYQRITKNHFAVPRFGYARETSGLLAVD